MLSKKQLLQLRIELLDSKKPLFFFHDDPDGLCSFILLYRFVSNGKGVVVKSSPKLTGDLFINKVKEFGPDKIFILDIPIVNQDFIDATNVPVIWIDHHEPLKRERISYYNGRLQNPSEYIPVSYWCYQVTKQDMWISMVGCIGDAYVPDFREEFCEKCPDLLSKDLKDIGEIQYNSMVGFLVKIFSFILKGKTGDVMKCIKILTRIEDPQEILQQKTARGKFIYKHFEKINQTYQALIEDALKHRTDDKILLYVYEEDKISVTADLANELSHRIEDKFIIIGRKKGDEIKLSIRWKKKIPPVLQQALVGIDGYGGGHEYACGACIKALDFDQFVRNLRALIDKA